MATKKEYLSPGYVESEAVKQAHGNLQTQLSQKPGTYQSQWQPQIDDVLGQIQNRPKFDYNVNADALYQQAVQRYVQQGRQAMMDTMGQAATMTGGYGNSYAQQVGQQTYQNHLLGLNDMIPQFHQMALDRYQMEGDQLMDQYGLLMQQENAAYSRYNDMLSQYYTELDRLQGVYDSERDYDYGVFADNRDFGYNQFVDDRNFQFQQEQAALEQRRWQEQMDQEQKRWQMEWDFAQRQYEDQMAAAAEAAAGKGSGGSGGGRSGYNYDTHGLSTAEIKALQKELGVSADGIWGPKTETAYQAKYGSGNGGNRNGSLLDNNVGTGTIPMIPQLEVEKKLQNTPYYQAVQNNTLRRLG